MRPAFASRAIFSFPWKMARNFLRPVAPHRASDCQRGEETTTIYLVTKTKPPFQRLPISIVWQQILTKSIGFKNTGGKWLDLRRIGSRLREMHQVAIQKRELRVILNVTARKFPFFKLSKPKENILNEKIFVKFRPKHRVLWTNKTSNLFFRFYFNAFSWNSVRILLNLSPRGNLFWI